jgi:hypothetical protein
MEIFTSLDQEIVTPDLISSVGYSSRARASSLGESEAAPSYLDLPLDMVFFRGALCIRFAVFAHDEQLIFGEPTGPNQCLYFLSAM